MFFSFYNRFFSKKSLPDPQVQDTHDDTIQKEFFALIAKEEKGLFFENFNLFYQENRSVIDLLLFLPDRGLLFGEKLQWSLESLEGASVERASKKNKKLSSTHLETTETAIRRKLEDILSFDSTVCERFFWMSCLCEEDFDSLDSSFHQLLPKERLIFSDSAQESIHRKFDLLTPKKEEPYSTLKVIGSLQSHTLLLPSDEKPYGAFLSEEQQNFLETDYSDTVTTLFGEYNSGKSTLIIRKALLSLLLNPKVKILIITPTLIGGEILRNEFISLLEYGALDVDLSSLSFYSPYSTERLEELDCFQTASIIMCDDSYTMNKKFIETLIEHREKRWLLLSMHNEYTPFSDSACILHNNYQKNIIYTKVPASSGKPLLTLLLELRICLQSISAEKIMVILPDDVHLADYKEAIDEYFDINTRILNREFSLQYQNLDGLILTTSNNTYGLHVPYVYYITSDKEKNYTYPLSRASESATIISFTNPKGENNDQNSKER
ncbi:MAG: hypothetical protein Q8M43_00860 [Sulfuricurvum sp.]|uniref:hypothetical protein n=1 Tax=Sulfuricurvum sp. TaxID=2025608 RepID=UPI002733D168|nr:hypothetical protein [Sulfuricurvum sp.]MDP3290561.1 hypothetical protein [Sulfuricurvum sp.]